MIKVYLVQGNCSRYGAYYEEFKEDWIVCGFYHKKEAVNWKRGLNRQARRVRNNFGREDRIKTLWDPKFEAGTRYTITSTYIYIILLPLTRAITKNKGVFSEYS